jgi:hypothetical protein
MSKLHTNCALYPLLETFLFRLGDKSQCANLGEPYPKLLMIQIQRSIENFRERNTVEI